MKPVVIKNLTKKIGSQIVLDNVSLDIDDGEFFCIMGPNGSGKTTLASIIAATKKPSSGFIEIFNKKPEEVKSLIGYVPQENFSVPILSGRENLIYFARIMGYSKNSAKKFTEETLEMIGLSNDANKRVASYSGGMKKKLEVATALFPEIKLLILDEPTTGLDPSARRNFLGFLYDLKDKGKTIVIITHIGTDAELASRVAFLNMGKVISVGTPERLKKENNLSKVLEIELSIKNKKVLDLLANFTDKENILETENSYKILNMKKEDFETEITNLFKENGLNISRMENVSASMEDIFFKLTGNMLKGQNN